MKRTQSTSWPERRVGQHHVAPVLQRDVPQRPRQRVVVPNLGGHIDAVHDHVGGAEQVRRLLLLDPVDPRLQIASCSGVFTSNESNYEESQAPTSDDDSAALPLRSCGELSRAAMPRARLRARATQVVQQSNIVEF